MQVLNMQVPTGLIIAALLIVVFGIGFFVGQPTVINLEASQESAIIAAQQKECKKTMKAAANLAEDSLQACEDKFERMHNGIKKGLSALIKTNEEQIQTENKRFTDLNAIISDLNCWKN